ncbi:MAG: tetratricopeptide repeat protein [Nitrospirae bacterium]|nr:MAG: tetratricopeptide repeat protein [Nitrospirota bacterium]
MRSLFTAEGKFRFDRGGVIILFLLSVIQYSYSVGNSFVWDSEGVFLHDPSIRDVRSIPSYFTSSSEVRNYDSPNPAEADIHYLAYYRPVTKLFHLLEYQIFGTDPRGYNAACILLNALVVVLSFRLINAVTGRADLAFLSSLFYAVNPARVEVVSWAYSDTYILMSLFILSSLLLYHKKRYAVSAACFAAALLSHELAVLYICILLLYEFLIVGERYRTVQKRLIPFLLTLVLYLAARSGITGPVPVTDIRGTEFLNTAAVIMMRYARIFFLPDAPVTVFQYRPGMFAALNSEVALSYVIGAAFFCLGLFLWKRHRKLLFWYLWFFVFCSITLNIGAYGDYLMADKILYLAALGPCVVIGTALLNARMLRTLKVALIAAAVLLHFSLTFHRTLFWKNSVTYFEKALVFSPDFYLLRYNLGMEYIKKADYEKAIPMLQTTLALRPGLTYAVKQLASACNELAYRYYTSGRISDAIRTYEYSLGVDPGQAGVHTNLGNIHYEKGLVDLAVREWEKATEIVPADPLAYYNLGLFREKRGDRAGALSYYRKYVAAAPDAPVAARQRLAELENKLHK